MFGEFEMHGQVKILATIAIVIFLRYSALKEVEGSTTGPSMGNYHKLFINTLTTDTASHYCKSGFVFNTSLHNLTIFTEGSNMTKPCECVMYMVTTDGETLLDIQVYTQNEKEKFDIIASYITNCGSLHINVSNSALILTDHFTEKPVFSTGLPAQIRITTGTGSVHLQCSHNSFQGDNMNWLSPCHMTTSSTTKSDHVPNSKPPITNPEVTKMSPELKTILLAVIIPAVILVIVILALMFCWRWYKNDKSDDGTVETDTIEVRTPKSKNAHLKLHNYENVAKPGILEVEHEAPHVYDNVTMTDAVQRTKDTDADDVLYVKVVKQITNSDIKALNDVKF